LKRIARRATKMGTGAFAIAAIDELMWVWPQAMRVKGSAAFVRPRSARPQPASRRSASPVRTPS